MAVLFYREFSTLCRIVVLHICLKMSSSHSEHLGLPNQPIALACYTLAAFLLTKKLSTDEHQSQGWPNELHSESKRTWPYCYNWIVRAISHRWAAFTRAVPASSRNITLDRLIAVKCHFLQSPSIPIDNIVTHTIRITQIHFVWDQLFTL